MSNTGSTSVVKLSARDRLLAAADELFYEGGIHSVGIDRVIERAGVAKASLYGTFGSKEALVQAYLQARHEARKARVAAILDGLDSPREQLLGIFDAMRESMAEPHYRGCAFNRAAAEDRPAGSLQSVCDVARGWIRQLFTGLARAAGAGHPDQLAGQLVLLYDGAAVGAQMEGGTAAVRAARQAAELLLDADLDPPAKKTPAARKRPKAESA